MIFGLILFISTLSTGLDSLVFFKFLKQSQSIWILEENFLKIACCRVYDNLFISIFSIILISFLNFTN